MERRPSVAMGLPVRNPAKCELAIHLNSAKKFGLMVPRLAFVRADEVIE